MAQQLVAVAAAHNSARPVSPAGRGRSQAHLAPARLMAPLRPVAVEVAAGLAERRPGRLAHQAVHLCRACQVHRVHQVRRVGAEKCSGADRPGPCRPGAYQPAASASRRPEAVVAVVGAAATSAVAAQLQPVAEAAAMLAALQPPEAEV